MTIVRCPRCRDEVRIPPGAGAAALVRCPLCLEQYLLSEAIAQVPPDLIVVSENVREGFAAPAVDGAPVPAGDEYLLADGGIAPGPFVTPAAKDALATATALKLNRRSRASQQEKNLLVEMAKVVLGGIAGLLLGMIVLWWVFRSDPLELGPSVARYAPWIVPVSLRGHVARPPMVIARTKPDPSPPPQREEQPAEPAPSGITIRESGSGDEAPREAMPDLTDLLNDSPEP